MVKSEKRGETRDHASPDWPRYVLMIASLTGWRISSMTRAKQAWTLHTIDDDLLCRTDILQIMMNNGVSDRRK